MRDLCQDLLVILLFLLAQQHFTLKCKKSVRTRVARVYTLQMPNPRVLPLSSYLFLINKKKEAISPCKKELIQYQGTVNDRVASWLSVLLLKSIRFCSNKFFYKSTFTLQTIHTVLKILCSNMSYRVLRSFTILAPVITGQVITIMENGDEDGRQSWLQSLLQQVEGEAPGDSSFGDFSLIDGRGMRKFRYEFIMAYWVMNNGDTTELANVWNDFTARIKNYRTVLLKGHIHLNSGRK